VTTRPFAVVLAGGGARGYAHVGALRALEHMGCVPAGIVGVSMGAVVAATYAVRADWYEALLAVPLSGRAVRARGHGSQDVSARAIRRVWAGARTAWSMTTGWGAPDALADAAKKTLDDLIGPGSLDGGRIPVTVCATDLITGTRVELSTGPAAPAVYASSALAGVLPPAEHDGMLLADGAYTDVAPVDVARRMGFPVVLAVDPSQGADGGTVRNGLEAVMRAMEICHTTHAHLSLDRADLVLRPEFGRFVDVLDFDARRVCVAAGAGAVRARRHEIGRLLGAEPPIRDGDVRQ
jgi:NTE family protein